MAANGAPDRTRPGDAPTRGTRDHSDELLAETGRSYNVSGWTIVSWTPMTQKDAGTPAEPDSHQPEDKCVVHEHPVPPEMLARYSPERDPDAELDIANYVHGQARDETVQHVELVKTEYTMDEVFDIWDVTTDKDRWWVLTNMTNLYSQKHFPSLDYTLSFHVGLMMRLRSRSDGPDSSDPQPFDEVFRRQQQAKRQHERSIEAVDYQAVGMQLRECLISLVGVLRRRAQLPVSIDKPQEANFKDWSSLFINHLCPGGKNKALRQYMKAIAERTWLSVNWLTHDRNANKTVSLIAIHGVDMLVGHCIQILMRERNDNIDSCPLCSSRNIRSHFDIAIEPDGAYYETCGSCNWSSHPGYPAAADDDSEAKPVNGSCDCRPE